MNGDNTVLVYMDKVCELERDRKQGWEESSIKDQHPACLASRHTTRLLELGS